MARTLSAERRITLEALVLLTVALGAAVISSDARQWDDTVLIGLLIVVGLASDRFEVAIGPLRLTMIDTMLIVAIGVCGPAPATALAVLVMGVDWYLTRIPRHAALTNLACMAGGAVAVGVVLDALADHGTIVRGEGSYVLAVIAGGVVMKAILTALLLHARTHAGHDWRAEARETVGPVLPWDVVGIGLAAGTVHAYATIGSGAIVVLALVLFFFHRLLVNLAVAERSQHEIARIAADRDRFLEEALVAEERERRRIAAELHDDALQSLLGARADIVDGLSGDEAALVHARDQVAAAAGKLRDLMVRLGPLASAGPLGASVRELATGIGRRAGFAATVTVDPAVEHLDDPLAFGVVRELLTNVAKHARAATVEVVAAPLADGIVLEVLDDGVGIAGEDREAKLVAGHVGLALLEQRVASRNGRLTVAPREGGGTAARAEIPLVTPSPSPAPPDAARSA